MYHGLWTTHWTLETLVKKIDYLDVNFEVSASYLSLLEHSNLYYDIVKHESGMILRYMYDKSL